jgi:hypothetical protein
MMGIVSLLTDVFVYIEGFLIFLLKFRARRASLTSHLSLDHHVCQSLDVTPLQL